MSKRYTNVDVIDMLSYDNGYSAGYAEGMKIAYELGYCDGIRRGRKEKAGKTAHSQALHIQHIYGGAILAVTAAVTAILMDVTFTCIGVPFGLWLLLTKKKVIV